ncbi:NADH-quinone oxidoreductase subunit NuoG [Deinococcus deserti]|uniref:NADH-quinone oxidoreductase n=1 Tax=Deinococcus deserti (strain DSM 17065 / CIP 109153 / LMG 22923 / VCD115) TaxID=546414 RepID=C1D0H7_DEIDV|nr:NADH-quinone oxidoreductase subunit NuoG [Deinococcus deserti]ACO45351.1 putative NADH dehydrogenase (quinone), subunit G (NADH-quinone oxidoreductase, subunit G) [Deinococcus deserti VCD115]
MKVTVDGIELDLPAGTSAIDAVFQAGRDVPYFCAHSYLSPVGACRMCLVEAGTPRKNPDGNWALDEATGQPKIFWLPKPMASCTMQATEGMHVRTARTSEVVAKAQAGMMEFTLLNHPLDCPTCDKGGACELQDRAFEYGYGASRYGFDRRHAEKHYPLSDFVVLDQERCIHCKRCVRYFEEVPGQEVLDFIERGGHTFIDTEEGGLPVGFQGNITDICPVGALLDNVARFRGRNWEYDHTPTTCTLCPVGCSITVDARNGRIERIVAGENREVNEMWICDAGRFGHVSASDGRLYTPLVRGDDGQLRNATWDEAIERMNRGFAAVNLAELGLYLSADSTLEEGVALEALAGTLGARSVDHWPRQPSVGGAPSLTEVATADAVVIVGADLMKEAPVVQLRVLEMLRGGLIPPEFAHGTAIADLRLVERPGRKPEKLAVIGAQDTDLARQARINSPTPGPEALRGLIGLESPRDPLLVAATNLLAGAGAKGILILGAEALADMDAPLLAAVQAFAASLGTRVLALPAGPNSLGLGALGLVPRDGGRSYAQLAEAPAAFISRLDPAAQGLPARARGFTVVHDTHLTATARQADVVLPAVTNYEKRGTTVNLEGRLLPLHQAAVSSGEAADLIRALTALAEALRVRTTVRGQRSAQALVAQRLGQPVDSLPQGGTVVADLPRAAAPASGLTHTPRLWEIPLTHRESTSDWAEHITSLVDNRWELPMHGTSSSAPRAGGDD